MSDTPDTATAEGTGTRAHPETGAATLAEPAPPARLHGDADAPKDAAAGGSEPAGNGALISEAKPNGDAPAAAVDPGQVTLETPAKDAAAAQGVDAAPATQAAAAPASAEAPAWDPEALRRAAEGIWVAAQKAVWSTLAIVPAEARLRTAELARAVAEVGEAQRGERVEPLDLEKATLANTRTIIESFADESRPYARVVALGCPTDERAAELLATSVAAAVLVLEQEGTRIAAARRVLEIVGEDRFLGAVLVTRSRA
jgi:hypothetical protein